MYYILAFICGIITALPLFFPSLSIIPWLSLAPVLWMLFKGKKGYRILFFWGIGYYGLAYSWFTELYPLDFLGFSPLMGGVTTALCWVGLALLSAAWNALAALLFRLAEPFCRRVGRWQMPICAACAWTVTEWTMTKTWAGVPFERLALTQVGSLPAVQSASLFGSLFVTFLVIVVAGFLAVGFSHAGERKADNCSVQETVPISKTNIRARRSRKLVPGETLFKEKSRSETHRRIFGKNVYVIIAVLVFMLNYCFGFLHLMLDGSRDENIRVALIQPNISSSEKWDTVTSADALQICIELSRDAVEASEAELIVWPETVINVDLSEYEKYSEQISSFAAESGAVIAVAAFSSVERTAEDGESEIDTYNSVYIYHADGRVAEPVYSKRKLVPFGEFVPLGNFVKKIFPPLADMNILDDDLTAADTSAVILTEHGQIGSMICFDSIYETLARDSVNNGAGLLLTATNDSWYGDSAALDQHLSHSVLRAIETGRYLVRSAATGISAVIDPCGRTVSALAVGEQGYIYGDVALVYENTLWNVIGNAFVPVCALPLAVGAGMMIYSYIRKRVLLRNWKPVETK